MLMSFSLLTTNGRFFFDFIFGCIHLLVFFEMQKMMKNIKKVVLQLWVSFFFESRVIKKGTKFHFLRRIHKATKLMTFPKRIFKGRKCVSKESNFSQHDEMI